VLGAALLSCACLLAGFASPAAVGAATVIGASNAEGAPTGIGAPTVDRASNVDRAATVIGGSNVDGAPTVDRAPTVIGASNVDGAPSCPGAELLPIQTNARTIDKATLCLIDQIRAAAGVPALRANRELGAVAGIQVSSMVRWNYFADTRPGGRTPLSLVVVTHYPANTAAIGVGQNIAWGTGGDATPAHIVAAWMASPPHRALILSSEYRDAGVAVKAAVPSILDVGEQGATYAMEFAVRRP